MKTILIVMICFIVVTSITSGFLMINDPSGKMLSLPPALLNGTPFKNFLLPGILLLIIVGGINFIAALYNILRYSNRYNWSMAGGAAIAGWIIIQMILISSVHWLHFVYLITGLLIMLIAYQLKGKWVI